MSDDSLSPKQLRIALLVLGAVLGGAIYWATTTRLTGSEPPYRSEKERADEVETAAKAAQRRASAAHVRAKLAAVPSARRLSEFARLLGAPSCRETVVRRRPSITSGVSLEFGDAPGITVSIPVECADAVNSEAWPGIGRAFDCQTLSPVSSCDVREAVMKACD